AKKTAIEPVPLKVLVGRELDFESPRKNGDGPKQSLNTTVITGRADPDDPSSMVVFYRSHLGSLGNLLEMLLTRRKPDKRKLTVQADLSTTNLVTNPELTSRFDIELAGCSAHARRPFAQYEDYDPKPVGFVLALFQMLAIHEDTLDRLGRNRENTLAVRGVDSQKMWEDLKDACTKLAKRWTKATPLGSAARHIIKHYERLTVYLRDPRLEATNNLRERLLRTEKLIEKSSMFRRSIEGRVVLDILRTLLQTAVAAGAPPHQYLVDVLKASPQDIEAHPENYTPAAWLKRQLAEDQTPAA
ncbi:MAG: transposase, partial [Myxococcales bacterium]|nr:transposase [Myxococcales bacterium]